MNRSYGMTLARSAVVICGVATALLASACSGHKGNSDDTGGGSAGQHKGGTLYVNNFRNFPHLDPQRSYLGQAISFEERTFVRTLETFPATEGPNSTTIVPDAATDTGVRS